MPVFLPFLLMFALLNSCIELEISAPSFVDIQHYFDVSATTVGLTITYNLLGFCIAALCYGPLSECHGRRRIMCIGNGVLAIGAIGCVIAPSMTWLIIARFIQGLGAATSAVVVSAIIADVYKPQKAAHLYGTMNAVFTTLMALSPLIGGLINSAIGWRGNYGIVALICLLSWILLCLALPETKPNKAHLHLKTIFHHYQKLFSNPLFLSAATVPSLLYGGYLAFVALAPFLYMQAFELTLFTYITHQAIVIAAFAISSAFSGKITLRLGNHKTLGIALFLSVLGSILMLCAHTAPMLTATMSLFCIGSALLYPIIFAYSMEIFPQIKGTASSAIMGLRYLLCSSITGLASYYYHGSPATMHYLLLALTAMITILTISIRNKLLTQHQP